jgi:cell division inhibitor SepF
MASVWKKTMVYLGLVDDEDDGYDYGYEQPAPAVPRAGGHVEQQHQQGSPSVRPILREEPSGVTPLPSSAVAVQTGPNPVASAPAASGTFIRTVPAPQVTPRVHVLDPKGFEDAQEVGDRVKVGQPVIVNLQGLERGLQRRLVDFCSGLTYALDGRMSKAADQVFLLTPSGIDVSQEEKDRLRGRGLYEEA